jgi:hypothetical protein
VWAARADTEELPLYLVEPFRAAEPLFKDRPKFTPPVFELRLERSPGRVFSSPFPAIAAIWDEHRDARTGDIWPRLRAADTNTGRESSWDFAQPYLRRMLRRGFSPLAVPVISSGARWLLLATPDNDIIEHGALLFDLACRAATGSACTPVRRFPPPEGPGEYVRAGFSPDERFLVMSQGNGTYSVYDMKQVSRGMNKPARVIPGSRDFLGFTREGSKAIFFAATTDRRSRIVDDQGPNGPEMEIWPLAGEGEPATFSVPSEFFNETALDLDSFVVSGPRGPGNSRSSNIILPRDAGF